MNSIPTPKYGIPTKIVGKKSLTSEYYSKWFDNRRVRKVSEATDRYQRFETKKYSEKKKQLRVPLEIGEDILILSLRIKKNMLQEIFMKARYVT